jgi:TolB-like protein
VIYRFECNILDTERRELSRSGVLCLVEPQIFDLLEYLIRNRHRVVARDDVLKAVWHGRIVSEAALNTRINAARRAIGDDGAEQRLIRTIRTKGYRFVGEVQEEGPPKAPAVHTFEQGRSVGLTLLDRPRVAVLPLANITDDCRQDPFANGVTEELITAFSKVAWLVVASRASCFAYKGRSVGTRQIARELGVRYLLQGSVRNGGDHARIAVQLVDGLLDQHIWAEQYDAEIGDVFAVQAEICEKVMAAIEPQLYFCEWIRAERKSPEDLNAWERMVRALWLMSSREKINASKAQALLQNAVSLENESAQAHSLLSIATTFRLHMGWVNRRDTVPLAADLARKAISLNPYEPWAHAALGYALIWKDPEEAIVPCKRAITLNSNLAISHYYLALASAYAGHCDQVFPHADMAERLAQRDLLARGYPGAANNVRSTGSFALGHYSEE